MIITLTSEIEGLVNEQINSGAFRSAEDVILLSLKLLKDQQAKHSELRRLMETTRAEMAQGSFTVWQTDEDLDAFTDQLIQQLPETQTLCSGPQKLDT